jgi:hypothetical protein
MIINKPNAPPNSITCNALTYNFCIALVLGVEVLAIALSEIRERAAKGSKTSSAQVRQRIPFRPLLSSEK